MDRTLPQHDIEQHVAGIDTLDERREVLLAVWLSGNALASINVVALHQTRLVLGWVTVCGRVNHVGM